MGYGVINPDGVTLEFTDPENGETFHFPPKEEERLDVDRLLKAKPRTFTGNLKKKKFRQVWKYGKKHGWTDDLYERIRAVK